MRRRDRDAARLLFRRRVDLVVRLELAAKALRADLRQRRRQRRLAVIHVTDRAHVHVRLGAFEFTLCHALNPDGVNELDERLPVRGDRDGRMNGAHDWNRTSDLLLTKEVLYRLSYVSV